MAGRGREQSTCRHQRRAATAVVCLAVCSALLASIQTAPAAASPRVPLVAAGPGVVAAPGASASVADLGVPREAGAGDGGQIIPVGRWLSPEVQGREGVLAESGTSLLVTSGGATACGLGSYGLSLPELLTDPQVWYRPQTYPLPAESTLTRTCAPADELRRGSSHEMALSRNLNYLAVRTPKTLSADDACTAQDGGGMTGHWYHGTGGLTGSKITGAVWGSGGGSGWWPWQGSPPSSGTGGPVCRRGWTDASWFPANTAPLVTTSDPLVGENDVYSVSLRGGDVIRESGVDSLRDTTNDGDLALYDVTDSGEALFSVSRSRYPAAAEFQEVFNWVFANSSNFYNGDYAVGTLGMAGAWAGWYCYYPIPQGCSYKYAKFFPTGARWWLGEQLNRGASVLADPGPAFDYWANGWRTNYEVHLPMTTDGGVVLTAQDLPAYGPGTNVCAMSQNGQWLLDCGNARVLNRYTHQASAPPSGSIVVGWSDKRARQAIGDTGKVLVSQTPRNDQGVYPGPYFTWQPGDAALAPVYVPTVAGATDLTLRPEISADGRYALAQYQRSGTWYTRILDLGPPPWDGFAGVLGGGFSNGALVDDDHAGQWLGSAKGRFEVALARPRDGQAEGEAVYELATRSRVWRVVSDTFTGGDFYTAGATGGYANLTGPCDVWSVPRNLPVATAPVLDRRRGQCRWGFSEVPGAGTRRRTMALRVTRPDTSLLLDVPETDLLDVPDQNLHVTLLNDMEDPGDLVKDGVWDQLRAPLLQRVAGLRDDTEGFKSQLRSLRYRVEDFQLPSGGGPTREDVLALLDQAQNTWGKHLREGLLPAIDPIVQWLDEHVHQPVVSVNAAVVDVVNTVRVVPFVGDALADAALAAWAGTAVAQAMARLDGIYQLAQSVRDGIEAIPDDADLNYFADRLIELLYGKDTDGDGRVDTFGIDYLRQGVEDVRVAFVTTVDSPAFGFFADAVSLFTGYSGVQAGLSAFVTLANTLGANIPPEWGDLPSLTEVVRMAVNGVAGAIQSAIDGFDVWLANTFIGGVIDLGRGFLSATRSAITSAQANVLALGEGFADFLVPSLTQLYGRVVPNLHAFVDRAMEGLGRLDGVFAGVENAVAGGRDFLAGQVVDGVNGVAAGVAQGAEGLLGGLEDGLGGTQDAVASASAVVSDTVTGLLDSLSAALGSLPQSTGDLLDLLRNGVDSLQSVILTNAGNLAAALTGAAADLAGAAQQGVGAAFDSADALLSRAVDALARAGEGIDVSALVAALQGIEGALLGGADTFYGGARRALDDVSSGVEAIRDRVAPTGGLLDSLRALLTVRPLLDWEAATRADRDDEFRAGLWRMLTEPAVKALPTLPEVRDGLVALSGLLAADRPAYETEALVGSLHRWRWEVVDRLHADVFTVALLKTVLNAVVTVVERSLRRHNSVLDAFDQTLAALDAVAADLAGPPAAEERALESLFQAGTSAFDRLVDAVRGWDAFVAGDGPGSLAAVVEDLQRGLTAGLFEGVDAALAGARGALDAAEQATTAAVEDWAASTPAAWVEAVNGIPAAIGDRAVALAAQLGSVRDSLRATRQVTVDAIGANVTDRVAAAAAALEGFAAAGAGNLDALRGSLTGVQERVESLVLATQDGLVAARDAAVTLLGVDNPLVHALGEAVAAVAVARPAAAESVEAARSAVVAVVADVAALLDARVADVQAVRQRLPADVDALATALHTRVDEIGGGVLDQLVVCTGQEPDLVCEASELLVSTVVGAFSGVLSGLDSLVLAIDQYLAMLKGDDTETFRTKLHRVAATVQADVDGVFEGLRGAANTYFDRQGQGQGDESWKAPILGLLDATIAWVDANLAATLDEWEAYLQGDAPEWLGWVSDGVNGAVDAMVYGITDTALHDGAHAVLEAEVVRAVRSQTSGGGDGGPFDGALRAVKSWAWLRFTDWQVRLPLAGPTPPYLDDDGGYGAATVFRRTAPGGRLAVDLSRRPGEAPRGSAAYFFTGSDSLAYAVTTTEWTSLTFASRNGTIDEMDDNSATATGTGPCAVYQSLPRSIVRVRYDDPQRVCTWTLDARGTPATAALSISGSAPPGWADLAAADLVGAADVSTSYPVRDGTDVVPDLLEKAPVVLSAQDLQNVLDLPSAIREAIQAKVAEVRAWIQAVAQAGPEWIARTAAGVQAALAEAAARLTQAAQGATDALAAAQAQLRASVLAWSRTFVDAANGAAGDLDDLTRALLGHLPGSRRYVLPAGTEAVSVGQGGVTGIWGSGWSDGAQPEGVSDDGRHVVFSSGAFDLVAGDRNWTDDVFVRDTLAGTTERVSVALDGGDGNGASHRPSMSADGRFVAFTSEASNLVAGDANGAADVFVRDREAGTTFRVSLAEDGGEANGPSGGFTAISPNGTWVAFRSDASNLVPGDTNETSDVFRFDLDGWGTDRMTVGPDGAQSPGPDIPDGRVDVADNGRVAFDTWAGLDPADGGNNDVYVNGGGTTTRLAGVSVDGLTGWWSGSPAISRDGRYVAFQSPSRMTAGDVNDTADVFVRDLDGGLDALELASTAGDGTSGDGDAFHWLDLSPDGRSVVFSSNATNLVPGDANDLIDVFVKDLDSGETRRVNTVAAGDGSVVEANGDSRAGAVTDGGRDVVFSSWAGNLVDPETDTNGGDIDVFRFRDETATPTADILAAARAALRDATAGWGRAYRTEPGLLAEFFDNTDFSGAPLNRRVDAVVDASWGNGPPAPGVSSDDFGVRWSGRIAAPSSGRYTLVTYTDDDVKLWLDGRLVLQGQAGGNDARVLLEAGRTYDVRMELVEYGGDAGASLQWLPPGEGQQVVPASALTHATDFASVLLDAVRREVDRAAASLRIYRPGLARDVYADPDLSGEPAVTEIVGNVDQWWWAGAPVDGVDPDSFGVRWTGLLTPQIPGEYRIVTYADDNSSVWVGGHQVVDGPSPGEHWSGPLYLDAGRVLDIRMETSETGGDAGAHLQWVRPDGEREAVPANVLSHAVDATAALGDILAEQLARAAEALGLTQPGLDGAYFNDHALTDPPALERADPNIFFGWGDDPPGEGVNNDGFAARWTGTFRPAWSGPTTFHTFVDDALKVWIGGDLVIDSGWGDSWVTLDLDAGRSYDFRAEMLEHGGGAGVFLEWMRPDGNVEPVPESAFRRGAHPTDLADLARSLVQHWIQTLSATLADFLDQARPAVAVTGSSPLDVSRPPVLGTSRDGIFGVLWAREGDIPSGWLAYTFNQAPARYVVALQGIESVAVAAPKATVDGTCTLTKLNAGLFPSGRSDPAPCRWELTREDDGTVTVAVDTPGFAGRARTVTPELRLAFPRLPG